MKTANYVFSALMAILARWVYTESANFNTMTMNDLGPALFPRAVALGLVFLSGVLIFFTHSNKVITYRITEVFDRTIVFPLVGILLSALYIAGLIWLGYLAATTLFVACTLWFLRMRRPVKLILVSICTSYAIYLVFEKILIVPLPRGMFL